MGATGVGCDPCPRGAACAGGKERPVTKAGFWLDESGNSGSFAEEFPIPCHPWYLCKGSKCSDGFEGHLCGTVKDSFIALGRGALVKSCSDMGGGWAILGVQVGLLGIWWFISAAFLHPVPAMGAAPASATTMWSRLGGIRHLVVTARSSMTVAAIFSMAQPLAMITHLPLRWPRILSPSLALLDVLVMDVSVWTPCGGLKGSLLPLRAQVQQLVPTTRPCPPN